MQNNYIQDNAKDLQANAASKLGTMQALGDYVSNMVSDYFNTEYLCKWKTKFYIKLYLSIPKHTSPVG